MTLINSNKWMASGSSLTFLTMGASAQHCAMLFHCPVKWMDEAESWNRSPGQLYYVLHSGCALACSFVCSLSVSLPPPPDRQTDRQIVRERDRHARRKAHCSLGVSIDPANHFIYCLINADSHLFRLRLRPRSIHLQLSACSTGRVPTGKHTLTLTTHTHTCLDGQMHRV